MGLTVTSHTEGLPGPQELRLLLCNLSKQAAEQSICRREFKPQLNREGQAALSMAWNPPPPPITKRRMVNCLAGGMPQNERDWLAALLVAPLLLLSPADAKRSHGETVHQASFRCCLLPALLSRTLLPLHTEPPLAHWG